MICERDWASQARHAANLVKFPRHSEDGDTSDERGRRLEERTLVEEGTARMSDANALEGRQEVLVAVEALQAEFAAGARKENGTLERFLDSFGALLGSIEAPYANTGRTTKFALDIGS